MHVTSSALILILITLLSATVNGALGYGFSSITVPVALLFYTNRVLNPVLVWIEVLLNAYVLWVNRASVPLVWRRVAPIILGLAPGVMMGTALVHRVQPGWLKLATFVVLLPLILLQAAGVRRPIKAERPVGLAFGGALGVLYSVTTISGPPLALMLSNQGFTKQDFRAGLGLVRLAESTFTATAYYFAGMFVTESVGLLPYILPSLVVGIPLGVRIIRHVRPETFRRVCMSFDAWVVGYGISTLLQQCRDAVSNHPGVETHADATESLGPHVANDPHAKRDSDDQARENVRQQADALGHEHPGEVVRGSGKGRFGEPHEPEAGAEVLLGKPLVTQHERQGRTGDGGDGVKHAERAAERQADGALGRDGPADPRRL